jgi:hypothetical protein
LTLAPARRKAAAQITGIGYHYPAPRGAHRLTGARGYVAWVADSAGPAAVEEALTRPLGPGG